MSMLLEGKFVFLHPEQGEKGAEIRGFEVIVAESFVGSVDDWNQSSPWDKPQNTPRDHFIQGFKTGYLAAAGGYQNCKAQPIIEELRKPLSPNEGFATMYERLSKALIVLLERELENVA